MDLTIEIPDSIHIHNTYVCPPVPKANKIEKVKYYNFDWDLKEKYIEDTYTSLEEFIYNIYNYDKIRILVKCVYISNNIKRIYLLTKDGDFWFRSYIDLNMTDQETKYYDISL